ncbi:hypothetical protein EfmAA242_14810 [Enterococcus faecium]|nr:hypothetical protein EfmAA242_14810 [Enterococcus faecium]
MTARWEGYLRKIGKQEGTPSVFLENIKKFILHLLAEVPNQIDKVDFSDEISGTRQIKAMEKKNDQLGRCPKCKKGIVMLYPKIATCLNPEFRFTKVQDNQLFTTNRNKMNELKTLFLNSKVVKGFTGKKGKFDAVLVLKEDMTIGFSFPWIENSGWRNMKKMKKYKIRKSGNSDVTTIPPEVKEFMGVQTGDAISYVFQSDGSVRMIKAQEEPDIDSLVDSIMNQYEDALKDLVDL